MELTTIDTNNYAAMAKAMGIANEAPAQREGPAARGAAASAAPWCRGRCTTWRRARTPARAPALSCRR